MRFSKKVRRFLLRLARGNTSSALGKIWLSALDAVSASPGPLARRFADEVQPPRPLRATGSLPPIEVVIACTGKDFEILPATVRSCLRQITNPIISITVVVPDKDVKKAKELETSAIIVGETSLLPEKLEQAVGHNHPSGRYGWVLQQLIGLYFARVSLASGVLVADSDTLFARSRAFLQSDGRQLLSLSHEYHAPYEEHATRVWGPRRRHFGLSYVTHHQLMQPWVLREMFPKVEDLAEWVLEASIDRKSPLADYHSYGRWLCDNYPEYVSLARWGNKSLARSSFDSLDPKRLQREISARFPHYFSVSLHSYLR